MHLFLESGFKTGSGHLVTDFAFTETKVSNFALHEDDPSPFTSQVHDFYSQKQAQEPSTTRPLNRDSLKRLIQFSIFSLSPSYLHLARQVNVIHMPFGR